MIGGDCHSGEVELRINVANLQVATPEAQGGGRGIVVDV